MYSCGQTIYLTALSDTVETANNLKNKHKRTAICQRSFCILAGFNSVGAGNKLMFLLSKAPYVFTWEVISRTV